MKRHRLVSNIAAAGVITGLLTLACSAAMAREDVRSPTAAGVDAIASCVDQQALRFAAGDRRVLLDAADAANVGAALVRRYPIVERDGLMPQRIVLWQKNRGAWLYVALLENPKKATDYCYTATFVAERFDVTAPLVLKYFGTAVADD
jgi:hypothetical protein